ncbi:MAG TPA: hydrogenase maturation protease [Methanomassiliicoccales archaeon]|jgi:hydrogenase maturation protease
MKSRTLVLGIGSPIVTDDAIGFRIVDQLRTMALKDVDLEEASTSGLDLIEMMLDYQLVIVVDAIVTTNYAPGTVMVLGEESFHATIHGTNPHEVNVGTALELGRKLEPERMPREIFFVAVEVNDVWTVGDTMTPEVEESLPEAVQTVLDLIEGKHRA